MTIDKCPDTCLGVCDVCWPDPRDIVITPILCHLMGHKMPPWSEDPLDYFFRSRGCERGRCTYREMDDESVPTSLEITSEMLDEVLP